MARGDDPHVYNAIGECTACGFDALTIDRHALVAGTYVFPPCLFELAPKETPVNEEPEDLDTTVLLLDTETTGTDKGKDQIIELAIQFGFGDLVNSIPPTTKIWRFKPGVPIHPVAQKVHGITMDDLARELPFKASAQDIGTLLDVAEVIIGYNVRFDLDMLCAELARAGLAVPDFKHKAIVDPLRLWHRFEPRTLAAAHHRFVGGDFEGAHNAAKDIAATGRVMLGMLDAFAVEGNWAEIGELCEPARKFWLGNTDHFKWVYDNDGVPVVIVTFGKHKDSHVHQLDPKTNESAIKGYLTWMLRSDFQPHVKAIAKRALELKGGEAFLRWARAAYPPPPMDVVPAEPA